MLVPIEKLKKGDAFNFPGKTALYTRGDYIRELKKYECNKWSDISAFVYKKKGILVEVDDL